jgi:hypothetical protein
MAKWKGVLVVAAVVLAPLPAVPRPAGREADGIRHGALLQRLVQRREGKRRVGPNDDGLLPSLGPVNDGQEHLVPPVSTVDVAWPERGGQTVARPG